MSQTDTQIWISIYVPNSLFLCNIKISFYPSVTPRDEQYFCSKTRGQAGRQEGDTTRRERGEKSTTVEENRNDISHQRLQEKSSTKIFL